ncbi:MAG: hypothetical protein ACU843_09190 [Gammaproteobacteria bacterium]
MELLLCSVSSTFYTLANSNFSPDHFMGCLRKKSLAVIFSGIFGLGVTLLPPDASALQSKYVPLGDKRPSIVAMGMDFLIVRPLTFALTVGGGVFWFLTLPVTAIGGNIAEAGDKFVIEPGRYTFVRPLGHMELDNSPVMEKSESDSAN